MNTGARLVAEGWVEIRRVYPCPRMRPDSVVMGHRSAHGYEVRCLGCYSSCGERAPDPAGRPEKFIWPEEVVEQLELIPKEAIA